MQPSDSNAVAQPVEGGGGTGSAASPAIVQAKAEPDAAAGSEAPVAPVGAQISAILKKVARAKGPAYNPVQEVSDLQSFVELEKRSQAVLDLECAEDLEKHKAGTKKLFATVNQLKDSVSKAAAKLRSHLSNIKRESERAKKKKSTQEEKQAVAQAKAAAKKAAETVKQEEREVPPLFNIDMKKSNVITPSFTEEQITQADFAFDASKPALLKWSAVEKEWMANSKVQMTLSAYGGQYKSQTTTKDSGKGQMALQSKAGKEETDALLKRLYTLLKLDEKVAALGGADARILKETWLYGYVPSSTFVAPTPQGLAMVKSLAAGETQMFLIKIADLAVAFKAQNVKANFESADTILAMTCEELNALIGKGCPVYFVKMQKYDTVYVPTGFLVIERSSSAVLIYGLRKTLCLKGDAASYEAVIQFVKDSGKESARYEQCLESIKNADSQ